MELLTGSVKNVKLFMRGRLAFLTGKSFGDPIPVEAVGQVQDFDVLESQILHRPKRRADVGTLLQGTATTVKNYGSIPEKLLHFTLERLHAVRP